MNEYCLLYLTCANSKEALSITTVLLSKKLIACAKQMPVGSNFIWEDNLEHDDEVLLIMDSRMDLFEEVQAEVTQLHSYQIFVLQAVPLIKINADAALWLKESLKY